MKLYSKRSYLIDCLIGTLLYCGLRRLETKGSKNEDFILVVTFGMGLLDFP
jgi:hypothetical protein